MFLVLMRLNPEYSLLFSFQNLYSDPQNAALLLLKSLQIKQTVRKDNTRYHKLQAVSFLSDPYDSTLFSFYYYNNFNLVYHNTMQL